ncbi:MAG: iron (metal) dependent repressor, DtxR family protein [Thermoplasmata archaeon HGW-Thermoplasmata-1]|nr:MAG: iron (metal) dependent repressor, DtxR family protein [Thermoplasmata archaeon HGW-Thermoplasmata-1]
MPTKGFEDYLEAIHLLGGRNVKTGEVAKHLEVNPASVSEMFPKLAAEGYVIYEKYRGVNLTDKGRKVGSHMTCRHNTLAEFLQIIGVGAEVAEKEACALEHSLSKDTAAKLSAFVESIKKLP